MAMPTFPTCNSATQPTKKSRKRKATGSEGIHQAYSYITAKVREGTPLPDAIIAAGMKKTTFYRWRPLAEMKLVDSTQYSAFLNGNPHQLPAVAEMCKKTLTEHIYSDIARQMRKKGEIL